VLPLNSSGLRQIDDTDNVLLWHFAPECSSEKSDWRSNGGIRSNLNLFRTLFGSEHFPRDLAAVDELKRLAAKYGKSCAIRAALDFEQPVVGTALVGFRTPAEVIENLDAVGWEISDADLARSSLRADDQGFPDVRL
jgi:aryl-alcohol dehydrogenase-like predicted oxidoreductase